MDPQKLSQLDPKLREAYQRVMGTSIPQPQTQPASPASTRGEPVQAQTPPMPTPMPDPTPAPQPQPQPEPEPTPPPVGGPIPTIEEPSTIPTIQEQPPTPEPQPISTPEPAIPEPQPTIPQSQSPTPEPIIPTPPAQANNFVQMNSEVASAPSSPNFSAPIAQTQTVALKKKNHLMPILIGIAALIFLVIYALFWTKIFRLKLPFLP